MTTRLLFWILLFIIIYAYLGYTLILLVMVFFKRLFVKNGNLYQALTSLRLLYWWPHIMKGNVLKIRSGIHWN